MTGIGWREVGLVAALACLGCGQAPRSFQALNDRSPLVRARAASLGAGVPEAQAVPALIARLEDRDPVVRLAAHHELKVRTGQDFGFTPWADPADRAAAVARWRSWWEHRKAGLAKNAPNL